ncbi:MbnP family protein [Adhaeribacter terreus]|uniref:MbnP family protein n=1 Tax=Adhaeribacter terreus TaxID=529703 RepID=A0ABW0EAX9_9BACT
MKKYSFLLLAAGLFLSACDNDDDDKKIEPAQAASVELEFDSRFGTEDFARNATYVTQNGDSVAVGSVLYFVSNVELLKADGSAYKVPDSYYLIENADQKIREKVTLPNIPAGEYTRLRFMVGVDSTHNKTVANAVGDLTLENTHMTWDWNTGYIFLNVNGVYYNPASKTFDGLFYEIGKDYSSRTVTLDLPAGTAKMIVGEDHNPKIHIHANLKTIFGGPNVIDVKAQPRIDGTPQHAATSIKVADNYATMFKIDHVHGN